MFRKPIYVSKNGGTINCFRSDNGFLFRVSLDQLSIYSEDFLSAKTQLDRLERLKAKSLKRGVTVMKAQGKELRSLVENAAAPYIYD